MEPGRTSRPGYTASRWRGGALCLGCLLAASAPGALAAPKTWIDRTSADFGRVAKGEVVSESFRVRNLGDEPLIIESARVSMPGMSIRVQQRIAPGEEATLTVQWDTANVIRQVEGLVTLSLNDPLVSEVVVRLTGTVFGPVDILPYPVVFLSAYTGEAASRTLEIVNNLDSPLSIARLEPKGDAFEASVTAREPGRLFELEIAVLPSTPIGRYRQFLTIHTDSPERPRLGVQVNILVKPEVYAAPEAIHFGEIRLSGLGRPQLAQLLTQTLTLHRRTGEMTIESITSDVGGLVITADPAGAAQVFRIDVRLDSAGVVKGPFDGRIVIRTDDEDHPILEVPVSGLILDR